ENIGERTVITFRPDMAACRDVVELHGDAYAIAGPAHAAFDHVADAELLAHLSDVDGPALVDEGGIARDDEEPAHSRQRRGDGLGNAVREILVFWSTTHIGEGKDRDGGALR